jgi:hypothetical protein
MMERSTKRSFWVRITPLIGILFTVLLVVGVAFSWSTPQSNARALKVITYYTAHKDRTNVSSYLITLSVVTGLFFFGLVRDHLSQMDVGRGVARVSFGGAVLFAVGGSLIAGTQFALADVPAKLSASAAQALNVMSNDLAFPALIAGMSVFLLAAGIAAVRTRLLPRWLGWVAIVLGLIILTPPGWIALLVAIVWIVVVSILLFLRQDKRPSELPEPE